MKSLKLVRALKPGDLVDLVSPGSGSDPEDVNSAVQAIESWGLRVRLPKETFRRHPFHSNEDEMRLKLLKKALFASDSQAVWCLRGGYGANRLLPKLWDLKPPKKSKLFIGYSDITSLHFWIQQKWKWNTYHGPLLETLISGRLPMDQIEELKSAVFGEKLEMNFDLVALNEAALKRKIIQAPVTGGNLVVLDSALGTKCSPQFKNHILALEDVGERGYRIDRMLEHLNQSQKLKDCLAIVFGDFSKGNEPNGENHIQFAIDRFAEKIRIPCFQGLEIGHADKNRLLPLGPIATLKCGKSGQLIVPTGILT